MSVIQLVYSRLYNVLVLDCFRIYDLNDDGYLQRDELFYILKNSMIKVRVMNNDMTHSCAACHISSPLKKILMKELEIL